MPKGDYMGEVLGKNEYIIPGLIALLERPMGNFQLSTKLGCSPHAGRTLARHLAHHGLVEEGTRAGAATTTMALTPEGRRWAQFLSSGADRFPRPLALTDSKGARDDAWREALDNALDAALAAFDGREKLSWSEFRAATRLPDATFDLVVLDRLKQRGFVDQVEDRSLLPPWALVPTTEGRRAAKALLQIRKAEEDLEAARHLRERIIRGTEKGE